MSKDSDLPFNPELLKGLGKRFEAMPEDRPRHNRQGNTGIVKQLKPAKQFGFGIDMQPPEQ